MCIGFYYFASFQSLGCILYALCYFKSPFDTVYERGDSVALAVMSAHVTFPEDTPYNEVVCFVFVIGPSIVNISKCY